MCGVAHSSTALLTKTPERQADFPPLSSPPHFYAFLSSHACDGGVTPSACAILSSSLPYIFFFPFQYIYIYACMYLPRSFSLFVCECKRKQSFFVFFFLFFFIYLHDERENPLLYNIKLFVSTG